MAKRSKWTDVQLQQLQQIANDSNRRQALNKIAEAVKLPYAKVYSKWYGLTHAQLLTNNPKAQSASSLPPGVVPMRFTIDKTVLAPTRVDELEARSMVAGLDMVIDDLEVRGGNIAVPTHLTHVAKKHLIEKYPNKVFSFSVVKDNKKMSRLFRKV